MFNKALIPWLFTLGMGIYIFLLNYQTENRPPAPPAYDFYDTTVVEIQIRPPSEFHDVYGIYNNIVEGQRQIVKADIESDANGSYQLKFRVNSPRPAYAYIDDEKIELFLSPEDDLKISLFSDPATNIIDSVEFEGEMAGICFYNREKAAQVEDLHFRSNRNAIRFQDFCAYSQKLDSLFAGEVRYIEQSQTTDSLPNWFRDFEMSELTYHKAYLKLSRAFNNDVPQECLDFPSLNNEGAVFSFYYYHYLKSFMQYRMDSTTQQAILGDAKVMSREHLKMADRLLEGEPKDVYITRVLFEAMKRDHYELVEELLDEYEDGFSKKKYFRFLDFQLKRHFSETL